MTDSLGYSLTIIFISILMIISAAKYYLEKFHKGQLKGLNFIFNLVLALLPMFYLFSITLKWKFSLSYLPSGNGEDLTYSSFHNIWLLVTLFVTIILVIRARKDSKSKTRYLFNRLDAVDHTLFWVGVMLVGIEVFKQLEYLNLKGGLALYEWYGFPLQFCSLPILLFWLTPFIKNKTIKRALYAFIGIFMSVAGISVMIIGQSVFTNNVAISTHTMLWHGAMVALSLYVLVARNIGKSYKDFGLAIAVLAIIIVFVQIINVSFHFIGLKHPNLLYFDGFFINPWISNVNMPVLSNIRINLQNSGMHVFFVGVIFSFVYFSAFTLGGLLIFSLYNFPYIIKSSHRPKVLEQVQQ